MNKDPSGNARYRRWYAKHREEVNRLRRAEYENRKANGLCPRCGETTGDGGLCDKCLEKARLTQQERRKKEPDPVS